MKKHVKKLLNAGIAFAVILNSFEALAADIQAGDIIKIGAYPATRIESVESLVPNNDYITADYHYCYPRNSSSVYFLKEERNYALEPICFKVISNDGTKVTAVSTEIIDAVPYHNEYQSVSYSNSSIKSYLEEGFKAEAFSDSELAALKSIRIPTAAEAQSAEINKVALATDYLETKYQLFTPGEADCWWVQSETASNKAQFVNAAGNLVSAGVYVDAEFIGVRPVIEFSPNRVADIDADGFVTFKDCAEIYVEGNDVILQADSDIDNTVLFVAVYDDNTLVDVKTETIDVRDGDTVNLLDFYNFTAERRLIKVIWLENMDTLKPVCCSLVMDRSEYGINVINYINQNAGISVQGNVSLQALGLDENVLEGQPWNPVEITLSVYNESGDLVYFDQTTADNNGDYYFNFNVTGYTGKQLTIKINNPYGSMAESTFVCEN